MLLVRRRGHAAPARARPFFPRTCTTSSASTFSWPKARRSARPRTKSLKVLRGNREAWKGQHPGLYDVCRPGRPAILALDRARTAGRQLRPDPRSHASTRASPRTSVRRLKRELPPAVAAARVTIEQLETGPPMGVPVQIRLFGDDIETLAAWPPKPSSSSARSPAPTTSTTIGTPRFSSSP